MKNPRRLLEVTIIVILVVVVAVLHFWLQVFSDQPLSTDPAEWAAFADYFGGMLNPIIAIANLVFLVYISFELAKREDNRNLIPLRHQLISGLILTLNLPRPGSFDDKYTDVVEQVYYAYHELIKQNLHLLGERSDVQRNFERALENVLSKSQECHAFKYHYTQMENYQKALGELTDTWYQGYWPARSKFIDQVRRSVLGG